MTQRYHALKKAADNKERNWYHWRSRYTVAGKNVDTRPKRPGLAWQELRASAALLLEWSGSACATAGSAPIAAATTANRCPSTTRSGPYEPCSDSGAEWASIFPTARRRSSAA